VDPLVDGRFALLVDPRLLLAPSLQALFAAAAISSGSSPPSSLLPWPKRSALRPCACVSIRS
jgi:hypothetical protein